MKQNYKKIKMQRRRNMCMISKTILHVTAKNIKIRPATGSCGAPNLAQFLGYSVTK